MKAPAVGDRDVGVDEVAAAANNNEPRGRNRVTGRHAESAPTTIEGAAAATDSLVEKTLRVVTGSLPLSAVAEARGGDAPVARVPRDRAGRNAAKVPRDRAGRKAKAVVVADVPARAAAEHADRDPTAESRDRIAVGEVVAAARDRVKGKQNAVTVLELPMINSHAAAPVALPVEIGVVKKTKAPDASLMAQVL